MFAPERSVLAMVATDGCACEANTVNSHQLTRSALLSSHKADYQAKLILIENHKKKQNPKNTRGMLLQSITSTVNNKLQNQYSLQQSHLLAETKNQISLRMEKIQLKSKNIKS